LLEVQNTFVAYGDLEVLHGVSLRVESTEIVALVGANGSGKTTLINSISGVIRPRGGEVHFEKKPIHHMTPHGIVNAGLVQVPEGRHIFPKMTVLENLDLGAYTNRARSQRQQSLEFVFNLFPRLRERSEQTAGTLSGGEQQMLAIGRALMTVPRLLMLDEPSQGLAPILVKQLLSTVKTINQAGCTILLVEQNVEDALELAARGYVLQTGRIVMEGSGQNLLTDQCFREAYFGLAEMR